MEQNRARFAVGDVVEHRLFGYRGVVIDVDASFQLSDEWYEEVARSRPPKDAPWYHVVVQDSDALRYVAEQNLEPDMTGLPVRNPALREHFEGFECGCYVRRSRAN
jgi:heat shock protein HspQ